MSLALYLVLTPLIACSFSQVLKTIFNIVIHKRKFKVKNLTADGNYPSSHTAFITSITIMAWINTIFKIIGKDNSEMWLWSTAFITVVWSVVVRDALGVRYTVQKLCESVMEIVKDTEQAESVKEKLDIKSGHRPHEVIAGAFWGALVAAFTSCIYYGWFKYLSLVVVGILLYLCVSFWSLSRKYKVK